MEIRKFVGDKIKQRRHELNLNQESLATACGLTRASIVNIEAGRNNTTLDRLYLICCILKIPTDTIFPPTIELKKKFMVVEKVVRVKKKKVIWK